MIDMRTHGLDRHRAAWICALGLALIAMPAAALAADSCPAADAAAQTARAAQQRLQQANTAPEDDMSGDVPAPLRAAIRAYKQALVTAIDTRLACSGADADAAALQRTLAAALGESVPPASDWNTGQLIALRVERHTAPRPLMLVSAGFGIPCGDDNLLAGYAWDRGRWRRVLRWQSGDYKEAYGAYGDGFHFAVLPGGQVVVVHGAPWCTSAWSFLGVAVIAPASSAAAQQRELFRTNIDYNKDSPQSGADDSQSADNDGYDDNYVRLETLPDGFELRASVGSPDYEVFTRLGIFRYRVAGDSVRRVQPVALDGRDFVDEWLQVSDDLARQWSDPATAAAVMQARRKMKPQVEGRLPGDDFRYGPMLACAGGGNRYQVEMKLSGDAIKPPHDWPVWYALIRQQQDGFTLLGLQQTPDAACSGPDLMPRRKTENDHD